MRHRRADQHDMHSRDETRVGLNGHQSVRRRRARRNGLGEVLHVASLSEIERQRALSRQLWIDAYKEVHVGEKGVLYERTGFGIVL